MIEQQQKWQKLVALATSQDKTLIDLFESDTERLEKYTINVGGLRADFSKQLVDDDIEDCLIELAQDSQLDIWRKKLFQGEKINTSERRSVLHMALRGIGGNESVKRDVEQMQNRMTKFAHEIRGEGHFKSIVHIGIGGSDLGPRLLADAFSAQSYSALELRFAENVDGASINDAIKGLNPETTLVIIVSKSFRTQETKMNGHAARAWLASSLGERASENLIAVTANRQGAIDFGIHTDSVFDFWDWVGGRYSVWSAVGLSLQIAFGPAVFREFLEGAAMMDIHFRDAPLRENMPVMMGLIGIWNRNGLGYESLAVIPYSRRLRKFSAFLQQLEMESNGKAIDRNGKIAGLTCPIIWGDQGSNGQHAFFQWLHQGPSTGISGGAPVDFLAILKSDENRPDHHVALLANCFAQSEALMVGKSESSVRAQMEGDGNIDQVAPQKTFVGNRPSTTLLLEELSARNLGLLIALYEHKVFVQSVIWEINAFDQWGVELGKELASNILKEIQNESYSFEHDASTSALVNLARTTLSL